MDPTALEIVATNPCSATIRPLRAGDTRVRAHVRYFGGESTQELVVHAGTVHLLRFDPAIAELWTMPGGRSHFTVYAFEGASPPVLLEYQPVFASYDPTLIEVRHTANPHYFVIDAGSVGSTELAFDGARTTLPIRVVDVAEVDHVWGDAPPSSNRFGVWSTELHLGSAGHELERGDVRTEVSVVDVTACRVGLTSPFELTATALRRGTCEVVVRLPDAAHGAGVEARFELFFEEAFFSL